MKRILIGLAVCLASVVQVACNRDREPEIAPAKAEPDAPEPKMTDSELMAAADAAAGAGGLPGAGAPPPAEPAEPIADFKPATRRAAERG